MIKKILYFFAFLGILYFAFDIFNTNDNQENTDGGKENTKQVKKEGEFPMFPQTGESWLPTSTTKQLVKHKAYTLSYSQDDKVAEWVAYKLTAEMLNHETEYKRSDNFRPDPAVKSAQLKDYSRKGYDRGHLCPAEDFAYDWDLMDETFFMSNMTPQVPDFNRGIWKDLEGNVRKWAQKYGEIYIVTGPLLDDADEYIGVSKVTIPKAFYKIIYYNHPNNPRAIAYIIQNQISTEILDEFVVSIDDIEKRTGINFFPTWIGDARNKIEAQHDIEIWKADKELFKARNFGLEKE